MITAMVETIFVFILFALIPSIVMLMAGSIGPFMILIFLMFAEYVLAHFVED